MLACDDHRQRIFGRRWLRDAPALPPDRERRCLVHQIQRFGVLSEELRRVSTENARRKRDIEAAVARAKEQLAVSRELLSRLDAILDNGTRD